MHLPPTRHRAKSRLRDPTRSTGGRGPAWPAAGPASTLAFRDAFPPVSRDGMCAQELPIPSRAAPASERPLVFRAATSPLRAGRRTGHPYRMRSIKRFIPACNPPLDIVIRYTAAHAIPSRAPITSGGRRAGFALPALPASNIGPRRHGLQSREIRPENAAGRRPPRPPALKLSRATRPDTAGGGCATLDASSHRRGRLCHT